MEFLQKVWILTKHTHIYYVLSTSRRVPRHAFETHFGLKVLQRGSKKASRERTRKSIEKVPKTDAKKPPKWVPGATKILQNWCLEALQGLGGTPGGLRGTPPRPKSLNLWWKITPKCDKKIQKYTQKCYRKSAVVAPLHMNREVKFTTEHQQTLH